MRSKKVSSSTNSIHDVARIAGVSITTVSRVINKLPSVTENNRSKVFAAIEKLNYHPSLLAQRLATGKSNVVMLVIPRYEGMFYSFYVLELIRGIGTLCEVLKLDLLLRLTDDTSRLSDLRGLGGVIFADIIANRPQLEDVLKARIPCVVINNIVGDREVDCVAIDNKAGAENAVNYLINLGHRRIAHITGDVVTQAAAMRLSGYESALKKHNIEVRPEYIFHTDYSRGQARQAAEKLSRLDPATSAVFVASDSMALEVMAVSREKGRQIPQDLSIVGFDDNPSGLYGPVSLTTVRQPLVKMAEEAVKRLHQLMQNKKAEKAKKVLLACELIVRESCQKVSVPTIT